MFLYRVIFLLFTVGLVVNDISLAQTAKIYEEHLTLETYGFSDPNPVPESERFYPYFKFAGFTAVSTPKSWKMVVLENDYIKVYVSPEIGGKIWGAIEKKTGKAFVYFNNVVKFRSVAMRGPWTSGGVEFNFGTIGHTPNVANPVDYKMLKNEDGSVSCIVGNYDLTSRTRWNVEITLDPDKAYFSTDARWFNLSDIPTSYYHWTNAAAKTAGNLEFLYPGTHHIGHSGEVGTWPEQEGNKISFYENNNFGSYKSYHILNTYTDFFGGYWHDDNFGFGHWTSYDEKPGKKLWIWGLSRQGMIWEDLLTDSDGQYMEWQSGKLFNQAATGSTKTPFKHKTFIPGDADHMHEKWFPLVNTGGADLVADNMVIKIEKKENQLTLKVMALAHVKEKLTVLKGGDQLKSFDVDLKPLELANLSVGAVEGNFKLVSDSGGEIFDTDPQHQQLERPLEIDEAFNWKGAYGKYVMATELEAQRNYADALPLYLETLKMMPSFTPAYAKLAMAYYRKGIWEEALRYAKIALSHDTYHPEANYVYGLVNRQLQNFDDARSGFAVATADGNFRVAAYLNLARLALRKNNYSTALRYAEKSISGNQDNLLGWQLKAISLRKLGKNDDYQNTLTHISNLDPTYVFVAFERFFASGEGGAFDFRAKGLTNELPHESLIALALSYVGCGLFEEAIACLETGPDHPVIAYWLSYLYHHQGDRSKEADYLNKALNASPEMVFPFRLETLAALAHAAEKTDHWKTQYYRALIYVHLGREEEARQLLKDIGMKADFAPFYLFRHQFMADKEMADIQKALKLSGNDWRTNLAAAKSVQTPKIANQYINKAYKLNPGHPELILAKARIYFGNRQYRKGFEFLKKQQLIPYEGANEGRKIYYENAMLAALEAVKKNNWIEAIKYLEMSKQWPENLGAGRPYSVDERLPDFVLAYAHEKSGSKQVADEYYEKVIAFDDESGNSPLLLAQLLAAKRTGNSEKLQLLIDKYLNSEHEDIQWAMTTFRSKPVASEEAAEGDFDKTFLNDLIEVVTP
ncbi:DUF5107 domain-containing protein [Fulvivirgaceae bacterium BMA12]|uniref:DUF5107 domain-containing protein n=1 Tax=Agaribacillus aureus TaxID=3051825 RepID=A0ABT8LDU0_9BACT|nr:DUF5107 domain-containing protein [Fulvivirgaceae bacterium BMA12]